MNERVSERGAERWKGAVFYQVYPRSFQDSDGDGVGDIPGILRRLPHIAALGVDGVWLSPVFRSPMTDYGYDISDYTAIDPLFGTMADFDALVAEVHRLGLMIIIDQVYSHTSDQHAWFAESRASRTNPKADWYVWADAKPDGSPPNNWLAAFGGGMWTWDSRRRQYYLHNFLPTQPDLNLHNPEVQDAILGVARFWLDRGVDGFRLDVANCYTHDRQLRDNPPSGLTDTARTYFMQRHIYDRDQPETLVFTRRLRALADEKPGRFLLAELAADDPEGAIADYTAEQDRFHTAYAFRFLSKPFGAEVIRNGVAALFARAPDAWPSWAFSNHDFERVASRWGSGHGPDFPKTLLMLLTALPGTIFLYQGEELGLPQAEVPYERLLDPDGLAFWPAYKGRDGCRTPMPWSSVEPHLGFSSAEPWLPAADTHRPLAVDRQEADPSSILHFTRAWLGVRAGLAAFRSPAFAFPEVENDDTLLLDRGTGDTRVRLACNLGQSVVALEAPGWRILYNQGADLRQGRLSLPAGAAALLGLE